MVIKSKLSRSSFIKGRKGKKKKRVWGVGMERDLYQYEYRGASDRHESVLLSKTNKHKKQESKERLILLL